MSTAVKSARDERWVSVERCGDRLACCILNPIGQLRFELTPAQAEALVDHLSSELRRLQESPSGQDQEEEEWREPEIM